MSKIAAILISVTLAAPALGEDAKGWLPAQIPWQAAAPNGTRYTLLDGDRSKGGQPFSYSFSIPAGVWDSPHSHSATARIFVVRGTLRIGYGRKLRKDQVIAYPAGSYAIVPAAAVHFDGSDEDTIIIGTATGPWRTTYLDGLLPASAGTPLGPIGLPK